MKRIFLLTALSLASLSPLSCFANTASLNQYDIVQQAPVTADRTTTEYKNNSAFTVLLNNGQLFSWGKTQLWGDENIVAPAIPDGKSVKEIFSSTAAFAALLDDGTILCWGDSLTGGTAPFVAPERQVISIASNDRGFVAILDNGTVVSWGDLALSADLLTGEDQGKKVVSVTSSRCAFAAVMVDPATSQETIISWGDDYDFGHSTTGNELNATIEVPAGTKVTAIAANKDAFAALLDNGTIKVWCDKSFARAAPQLPVGKKVVSLAATDFAFTVLFEDGTIQCWGNSQDGGKTPTLPTGSMITKIFATERDFAALLSGGDNDGNILSWGAFTSDVFSGNSKIINKVETVSGGPATWSWKSWKYVTPPDRSISIHIVVKSVVANGTSFTAILDDGSVIAWGFPEDGGATPSLPAGKQVVSITPCSASFTALFDDGTIQAWGGWRGTAFGGKTPTKIPAGRRVVALTSDYNTYMALLDNGSLFSWGGDGDSECDDGQLISLPEATKALWMVSPFEKYVLKTSSSQ